MYLFLSISRVVCVFLRFRLRVRARMCRQHKITCLLQVCEKEFLLGIADVFIPLAINRPFLTSLSLTNTSCNVSPWSQTPVVPWHTQAGWTATKVAAGWIPSVCLTRTHAQRVGLSSARHTIGSGCDPCIVVDRFTVPYAEFHKSLSCLLVEAWVGGGRIRYNPRDTSLECELVAWFHACPLLSVIFVRQVVSARRLSTVIKDRARLPRAGRYDLSSHLYLKSCLPFGPTCMETTYWTSY